MRGHVQGSADEASESTIVALDEGDMMLDMVKDVNDRDAHELMRLVLLACLEYVSFDVRVGGIHMDPLRTYAFVVAAGAYAGMHSGLRMTAMRRGHVFTCTTALKTVAVMRAQGHSSAQPAAGRVCGVDVIGNLGFNLTFNAFRWM